MIWRIALPNAEKALDKNFHIGSYHYLIMQTNVPINVKPPWGGSPGKGWALDIFSFFLSKATPSGWKIWSNPVKIPYLGTCLVVKYPKVELQTVTKLHFLISSVLKFNVFLYSANNYISLYKLITYWKSDCVIYM